MYNASLAINDNGKGGNIFSVILGKQKSCKNYIFKLEPIYVYFDQKLYDNRLNNYKIKKFTASRISVLQYDLSGNFIKEYSSILEASEKVFGSPNNRSKISKCCKGEINS